jgi:hypothetical protein
MTYNSGRGGGGGGGGLLTLRLPFLLSLAVSFCPRAGPSSSSCDAITVDLADVADVADVTNAADASDNRNNNNR